MTALLAFLLKVLSGPVVDRTLAYMEKRASLQNDRERIRADIQIETIRQAVETSRIMADVETSRYGISIYWLFVGCFVVPLALWWAAVILDSIFGFSFSIAALPDPLGEWAGMIVGWLFLAGGIRTAVGRR